MATAVYNEVQFRQIGEVDLRQIGVDDFVAECLESEARALPASHRIYAEVLRQRASTRRNTEHQKVIWVRRTVVSEE